MFSFPLYFTFRDNCLHAVFVLRTTLLLLLLFLRKEVSHPASWLAWFSIFSWTRVAAILFLRNAATHPASWLVTLNILLESCCYFVVIRKETTYPASWLARLSIFSSSRLVVGSSKAKIPQLRQNVSARASLIINEANTCRKACKGAVSATHLFLFTSGNDKLNCLK